MAKADIMAGRAYVSLYMKNDLTKALQNAKSELQSFGAGIAGIGLKVTAIGAGIVGSLSAAVSMFANVGSELNDLSARTGLSISALSELGYAADMTGGSMEILEGALNKMHKNLADAEEGADGVVAALHAIHLSISDLAGMPADEQFNLIAKGIAQIESPARRAAVTMALFGKSGTQLIPMMQNIEALRQEARDLGIAPSPEAVSAADEIGDAIDRVRKMINTTILEIGASLAPMAMEIIGGFTVFIKAVRRTISENKPLMVLLAKVGIAMLAAGAVITAVGHAFIFLGSAVGGVMAVGYAIGSIFTTVISVFSAVGAILLSVLSPVGLLVAALTAGVYAWARFTEGGQAAVSGLSTIIGETFGAISTTVTETLGGIVAAIQAGDLKLAGQIAMIGLRLVMMQGLEAIHSLFGESWGALASQLLSGDFAGAWSTFGSMILDTMAGVASGMVSLFSTAANAVMNKWQQTVNKISDYILESASEGGVMGWALEQISGVNMQEETARAARLNQQAGQMGLAQDAGVVTSAEYQDPALEAMKAKVAAAGEAAKAAMDASTEATGTALADATAGSAAQTSESVKALQAELAALQAEAANKLAAVKSGQAESGGKAAGGMFGPGGSSGGKSSGASFNLAQLAMSSGRGVEYKQLAATEKATKLQEQQVDQMSEMVAAVKGWSLHHA